MLPGMPGKEAEGARCCVARSLPVEMSIGEGRHGTLRFTALTESVAAAKSKVAPEMFRAITRTVLFDHTAASSSMNRVDDTSDACARSPARAPFTVTSISEVAAGARLGRSQDTSAANSRRPEPNSAPVNSGVQFSTSGAAPEADQAFSTRARRVPLARSIAAAVPLKNNTLTVSAALTAPLTLSPCRSSEKETPVTRSPSAAPATVTVVVTPLAAAIEGASYTADPLSSARPKSRISTASPLAVPAVVTQTASPIHPEALPVIVARLTAPTAEALTLQRPVLDGALIVVARGPKQDGAVGEI